MQRWLAPGTFALSLGLALNSLLGPFVFDAIDYPFSETVRNQGVGLDAVSLIVVAPVGLIAAWAMARRRAVGSVLALAVGAYTAYMMVQYLVGPNYTAIPRVYPFQLALLTVSVVVSIGAWSRLGAAELRPARPGLLAGVMFAIAAFVVLRYLPTLLGAVGEETLPNEYAEDPAFYWTIATMDLALFTPAAVAAGIGLLAGAAWAARAAYALAAWFVLVTVAVFGMSIAMTINDDPYASNAQLAMFAVLSAVSVGLAAWLWSKADPRPTVAASCQ